MNALYYFLGVVACLLASVALSVYDDVKHSAYLCFWSVYARALRAYLTPAAIVLLVVAAIAFVVLFAASLGKTFC